MMTNHSISLAIFITYYHFFPLDIGITVKPSNLGFCPPKKIIHRHYLFKWKCILHCLNCQLKKISFLITLSCRVFIEVVHLHSQNGLPGIHLDQCFSPLMVWVPTGTIVMHCKPEHLTSVCVINVRPYSFVNCSKRSMFGLNSTPQLSLEQMSQIGQEGFFSLVPTFRCFIA